MLQAQHEVLIPLLGLWAGLLVAMLACGGWPARKRETRLHRSRPERPQHQPEFVVTRPSVHDPHADGCAPSGNHDSA